MNRQDTYPSPEETNSDVIRAYHNWHNDPQGFTRYGIEPGLDLMTFYEDGEFRIVLEREDHVIEASHADLVRLTDAIRHSGF